MALKPDSRFHKLTTPVREWHVAYMEKGFAFSIFHMWFASERAARAFAARHDSFKFHPRVEHVPYSQHSHRYPG